MDVGIPEIGRSGEEGGDGHDDNLELRTCTVIQAKTRLYFRIIRLPWVIQRANAYRLDCK
jgi:hypothetical protein